MGVISGGKYLFNCVGVELSDTVGIQYESERRFLGTAKFLRKPYCYLI